MRHTEYSYEVYMTLDDEDYTVTGRAYYYPGRDGRYSGPPEDCYPDEPDEMEVQTEVWEKEPYRKLTDNEEEELFDKIMVYCREEYQDGEDFHDYRDDRGFDWFERA